MAEIFSYTGISMLWFLLGYAVSKSAYQVLIKKYEDDIATLKGDVEDRDEEIKTLNVKYGLEDIDWEANMWADEEPKLPN